MASASRASVRRMTPADGGTSRFMDANAAHQSRGGKASVIGAWLLGSATLVLAACVAVGMVRGSDRSFDQGVAPVAATITQEVAGAIALVALASVAWRLRRFARGDGVGATIGLFSLSIVLCLVWVVAYAAQHAS
jgi:hypothetical protein